MASIREEGELPLAGPEALLQELALPSQPSWTSPPYSTHPEKALLKAVKGGPFARESVLFKPTANKLSAAKVYELVNVDKVVVPIQGYGTATPGAATHPMSKHRALEESSDIKPMSPVGYASADGNSARESGFSSAAKSAR